MANWVDTNERKDTDSDVKYTPDMTPDTDLSVQAGRHCDDVSSWVTVVIDQHQMVRHQHLQAMETTPSPSMVILQQVPTPQHLLWGLHNRDALQVRTSRCPQPGQE